MRDPIREKWFDSKGYTWKYEPSVNISAILMNQHAVDQIRLREGVRQPTVDMYTAAMRDGAIFPPLLLGAGMVKHLPVADGIHRLHAAKAADIKTFDAYLIDLQDEEELEVLRRLANIIESVHGLDVAERVEQALRLVVGQAWSIKKAAQTYGVGVSQLRSRESAAKAQIRIVKTFPHLTPARVAEWAQSILAELGTISNQRDEIFTKLAEITIKGHLRGEDVKGLVTESKKAITDAQVKMFLTDVSKQYEDVLKRPMKFARHTEPHGIQDAPMAKLDRARNAMKRALTQWDNATQRLNRRDVQKAIDHLDYYIKALQDRVKQFAKRPRADNQKDTRSRTTTKKSRFSARHSSGQA